MKIMSQKEQESSLNLAKFESVGSPKAASRFRAFRLVAEHGERKLKENEMLIDRLKDEINFSREAEKNLTNHIGSIQDRLIGLQDILKSFINISERQRQNGQISQKIEQTVAELSEKINRTRQECRNIFQRASREADFLKKIKELESTLAAKNNEHDLMKMEIEALTKEKEHVETRETLRNLEKELENLVRKEAEAQAQRRETRLYYEQQIEHYEQKIAAYESERRSYLEDFEPPNTSKTNNNFAWADSTVIIKAEEKTPITSRPGERGRSAEESDQHDIHQPWQFPNEQKLVTSRREKEKAFSGKPTKRKPQLGFLTSEESSRTVNSANDGKKRRLFSANCNHYVDYNFGA